MLPNLKYPDVNSLYMFQQIAVLGVKIPIICCLKVFDIVYLFAIDDVKLNKFDANLLDFVAYISIELVVESIGSVYLNERCDNPCIPPVFSGLVSCPLSYPVL